MQTAERIKIVFDRLHEPVKGKIDNEDFVDLANNVMAAVSVIIDEKFDELYKLLTHCDKLRGERY